MANSRIEWIDSFHKFKCFQSVPNKFKTFPFVTYANALTFCFKTRLRNSIHLFLVSTPKHHELRGNFFQFQRTYFFHVSSEIIVISEPVSNCIWPIGFVHAYANKFSIKSIFSFG